MTKRTKGELDNFDISCTVAPRFELISSHTKPDEQWPMYSYERPAYTLWNAVGKELYRHGWTMEEIREVLQSKYPRWALDGTLGEAIAKAGRAWAKKELLGAHEEVKGWIKEGL